MNITIHTKREIPQEVRELLEQMGQAELAEQYDRSLVLSNQLYAMGWMIALRSVDSTAQTVDLYVSRKEH